jgi:hypothetical protein
MKVISADQADINTKDMEDCFGTNGNGLVPGDNEYMRIRSDY